MAKRREALDLRWAGLLLLFLLFLAIPWFGESFYIRLFTRIMIYAMAAISLDLILGYGGMVSFGHAAFLGVGAYTVGILSQHGVVNGFIAWPVAMAVSALIALVIGAISLRTSGVYFIMITLAFAQMLYYFVSSLEVYGGDDGIPLLRRNTFDGLMNISNHRSFYYLVFFLLLLLLYLSHRLVHSRFGMVIRGIQDNERRMRALGYATFRYKLVCFVMAGTIAGLAGALIANQTLYISPAFMHWTRSGDLIVMVILGGMGSLFGPVLGAMTLLLLEDLLSSYTAHWMIILGPVLICIVLFAKQGIYGLLTSRGGVNV
jgi:branched-chain amino acid transport system permease protein